MWGGGASRARACTNGNIEIYGKMSKEASQTDAKGFLTGWVAALEVGDMEATPKVMNVEGY